MLNPVESDGPALRIHQALTGLQESMQRLAQERDEAREELVELKKVQPADPLAELTAAQLKKQLDAKGIAYKSGDLKPELLALLKAAQ
ncbi:HeH/LEM domain protein [compost metagenome]